MSNPSKTKKVRKGEVIAYAFWDTDEERIMPPDVCKFFSSRWEARLEKKKYNVFYSNTKIVKVKVSLL